MNQNAIGLNFTFSKSDQTAGVDYSPDTKGNILIPRTVINRSKEYIITSIEENSFINNKNIISISFVPNSCLSTIKKKAFYESSLQSISLPESLQYLEPGWCKETPFLNQISMSPKNKYYSYVDQQMIVGKDDELIFVRRDAKKVIIPSFIKRIGEFAFDECESIEKITFSEDSQLQSIGNQAFFMSSIRSLTIPSKFERFDKKWCSQTLKLNNIIISPHNRNFQWYDDKILIGKSDQKSDTFDELVFARRDIKALTVPNSIKRICPFAFNTCYDIKTITFSEDSELRYIGYQAFADSKIKTISIPSKFEDFDDDWIYKDEKINITSISPLNKLFHYIDDQIIVSKLDRKSEIFDLIVYARRNISEIVIPSYIKKISSHAFSECKRLQKVEFSKNSELQFIGKLCFYSTAIKKIRIPSHVREIGEMALALCQKLKKIEFDQNSELNSIGFEFLGYTDVNSITIPSKVTKIEKSTFIECKKLKAVEFLGESLIIESEGFANCNLHFLLISLPNAKHIEIGQVAFAFCSQEVIVYACSNSIIEILDF